MHVGCIYCVIVLFLEEKSCKILVRKLRQKGKIQTIRQLEKEITDSWKTLDAALGFICQLINAHKLSLRV